MRYLVPALIAAAPLLAQAPIPATPAGQRLQAYLEIINSGEAARIAQFASENCSAKELRETPAEQHGTMVARIRANRGKLILSAVDTPAANAIKAILVNADRSQGLSLSFKVTAHPPHLMEDLIFKELVQPMNEIHASRAFSPHSCGEGN